MTKKTYPTEIVNEITKIAGELNKVFKANKGNLRNIAKFSGMSVNSVKAVLAGKTANIASYAMIAKALGTSLMDVIHTAKTMELNTKPVSI
jgi:lambda repressor-like predicted transcriptional regulator